MSCHSAIRTIDHLSEIMVAHESGSTLGQKKLHRTKCMALIKNVISPELKSDLIKDIQNKKFTLTINKSTDVSTQKYLCILVSYLSDKTNQITNSFLSLIPVQEATGDNIFSLIKVEIESCNQDLKNCIGFSSDGASNMVGCNNSVWSRIRDVSPSCVQYRCVCHSLALCIKYAVSKLPSSIGFLLTEIPNWFRHSNLRREAFKHLFKIMNSATEFQSAKIAPLSFEKTSSTRWLVRGKVMFNILVNWEELKAYFISAELAQDNLDSKYKARVMKEMLLDQRNYLFFHFATPCVQEFERLNSLFQKNKADPHELHDQLFMHYRSLHSRIYDADEKKKHIHDVDFGAKFLSECDDYIHKNSNNSICRQVILDVKERCLSMLEEALDQVEKRLPAARNLFKDLISYSPAVILNQVTRSTFSKLPFLHLAGENLTIVEE